MAYCANIIGLLFYYLQKILNPATSFRLFLVLLFWCFLSISEFSWYIILLYSVCRAGFVCTSFFDILSVTSTLLFNIIFYFLYFIGIFIFGTTVALPDFPVFPFLYVIFDILIFTYFSLWTLLQIFPNHHISFLLPVVSFLDFCDMLFFEDSNLPAALLAIALFL